MRIPLVTTVLLIALVGACTVEQPEDLGEPTAAEQDAAERDAAERTAPDVLYVMRGPGGVADGRVSVQADRIVWFTDRPDRDAGQLPVDALDQVWADSDFDADPPNAALHLGDQTTIVELTDPRFDAATGIASFALTAVSGALPADGSGEVELFIDDGTVPTDPSGAVTCPGTPLITASAGLGSQCEQLAEIVTKQLVDGTWLPPQGEPLRTAVGSFTCSTVTDGWFGCAQVDQQTSEYLEGPILLVGEWFLVSPEPLGSPVSSMTTCFVGSTPVAITPDGATAPSCRMAFGVFGMLVLPLAGQGPVNLAVFGNGFICDTSGGTLDCENSPLPLDSPAAANAGTIDSVMFGSLP
jgi:hypothetical protein